MSLSPAETALAHTDLEDGPLAHLQRLMASWGMLADLCFSDLLLFAPAGRSEATAGRGDGAPRTGGGRLGAPAREKTPTQQFVILGQMRPTSARTLHWDDLIGRVTDSD